MATTVTTYGAWGNVGMGEYRLRMTINRTSVNIANNTSTVRSRVWVEARAGGWFWNISSAHGQSIDGVQVYSGNVNRTVNENSSALVLDNSRVITHNANGTRTVGSAATFSNYATGNLSVSASLTLDTIPRATTPSVSGSFTTGSSKTISLPYASSSFRHDLTFRIGSTVVHTINNAASSATWTPPHSLAERFTNSASTTLQLTTVTKTSASGSSIGSKVNNYTLNAGSAVVPSVSQVTWVDQNPLTTNIGALVQGQSRVKGVVTASGIYNSTITNRSVTVSGVQYTDTVAIELPSAGTITASGTATDSRGRSATRAANFNVLPYEVPQIGSGGFQVSRADSSWAPADLGTNLIIDLDAFATSLEVGSTEKNQLTVSVHTRPASGGAWTARNVITGGLTYNGRIQVTGGSQFPVEQSYEVRITLSDNVADTPTELITTIPTATVALDLNGTQVGIGKYHERGALDAGGAIFSDESMEVRKSSTELARLTESDLELVDGSMFTRYGLMSIDTPYGLMGTDFRGTSAQRVALGVSGAATEGVKFFDTDESLDYVWRSGEWVPKGKLLWEGGWFMNDSQVANLSELVSEQENGIILCFSEYTNSTARNYNWHYVPVPKAHVVRSHAQGVNCITSVGGTPTMSRKYLYVHNDKITGQAANATAPNNQHVMREVRGF